jgi:cytoplasmic FMR1 interacting protein
VEAIIRLVGQESLALIVETCISFIEDKLTNDLAPYVSALMEAIPPRVTLQPAAYKLEGVYGYFQMVFRDFLDYGDLKPGVFQSFRVLGNCIAFLQLLDTCQLSQNVSNYMSAAPFMGIQPLSAASNKKREELLAEFIDKEDDISVATVRNRGASMVGFEELLSLEKITDLFISHDNPEETPLVRRLQTFITDPNVLSSIRAQEMSKDLPRHAARAVKMYTPPRQMMSLFKQLLERMKIFLDKVREPWKGTSPPDRLQKLDSSKEFYRLWGILQFVFCLKDKRNQGFSDFDVFGDGFYWAGCTIIYLFGQQLRFDAFNFSDHVINIDLFSDHGRSKLQDFLQTAAEVRSLNDRIFNTLRSYYPMPPNEPECFEPPSSEEFVKAKIIASVDTSSYRQSLQKSYTPLNGSVDNTSPTP